MKASSRKIEDLTPEMQEKARAVLAFCEERRVDILITSTLRNCADQARLFRQSRTLNEIDGKVAALESAGYFFLARILQTVGPVFGQLGKHVTWAGPGESWHQWGMAFDAYPIVHGKPDLEGHHFDQWEVYGEAVEIAGLSWAGRWVRNRELPHAQDSPLPNPLKRGNLYLPPMEPQAALLDIGAL